MTAAALLVAVMSSTSASPRAVCSTSTQELRLDFPGFSLRVGRDDFALEMPAQRVEAESQAPGTRSPPDFPITGIVAGPSSWVVAVRGNDPGLYRFSRCDGGGLQPSRLAAGEVARLCDYGDEDGWAVISRNGQLNVIGVSARTPAVSLFAMTEAISKAVRQAKGLPSEVVGAALKHILKTNSLEADQAAWAAAQHPDVAVRFAVATRPVKSIRSMRGSAALWLVSFDIELDVRRAAYGTVCSYCDSRRDELCAALLAFFVRDASEDLAWTARDRLLDFDVERALVGASSSYKLEALALLTARLEANPRPQDRRALDLLVADPDPTVRQSAVLVLNRLSP